MSDAAAELFKKLREELVGTEAYPWTNLEAWVAKATPIVRAYFPNHMSDFEKVSSNPKWDTTRGWDRGGNYRYSSTKEAEEDNASKCEAVKAKLLSWVDGVILMQGG